MTSVLELGAIGCAVACLGLTACRKDPVAAFDRWSTRACTCTDERCAREAAMASHSIQHEYSWVLDRSLQQRANRAHVRGALCLRRFGIHLQ